MASSERWSAHAIKKKHLRAAAKLWDSGQRLGFINSTKYDVVIDGRFYPPKAICSFALKLAADQTLLPSEFAGANGGFWHQVLLKYYPVIPKYSDAWEDFHVKSLSHMSLSELEKRAFQAPPTAATVQGTITRRKRDRFVRALALRRAKGKCLDCKVSPFISQLTGMPYLEVHHVVPLSQGGLDHPNNVVALCPNCHAERHDLLGVSRDDE